MVSSQARVPGKSRKTKGQVSVTIRGGIPFHKKERVIRTQVVGKAGKHIVTKSTKVVVPVVHSEPLEPLDALPDYPDLQEPPKLKKKGPSRSVAVSSLRSDRSQ